MGNKRWIGFGDQRTMQYRLNFISFLIISFVLSACGNLTDQSIQETAEQFWIAIEKDDYARAQRFLADSLAQQTSTDKLRTFINHTGLGRPSARSWQEVKVDGDRATLSGFIHANDQSLRIPVRLSFQKENINWRIAGLERGIQFTSQKGLVTLFAPGDQESARLAKQTISAFANAVNSNNLQGFWDTMASTFKQRYSANHFASTFQGFIRDNSNLMPAIKHEPVFKRIPNIDRNGELVLEGMFPTKPSRIDFQFRYILEENTWKNSGLEINLIPQG